MSTHKVVLIPGDGIGPEISEAVTRILKAAGADIVGVAVNTNTNESVAWNLARATTFVKAATAASNIPVHVNVGMGVGGVPMMEQPPIDSVSRVSKSLVQLGKADGL